MISLFTFDFRGSKTHMMGLAPSNLSEFLRRTKSSIEGITLLLSTCILPIRAIWMSKRLLLELVNQGIIGIQTPEKFLAGLTPIDTSMLLTSTGNAFDPLERSSLLLQSLED